MLTTLLLRQLAKEEEEATKDEEGRLAMPLGLHEVSVYEVLEHSEYHYNMGDVVVRLSNAAPGEPVTVAPTHPKPQTLKPTP